MIKFTPELVMFPDFMSFEHPKVLLFLLVIHYKSRCPSKSVWNTMHYKLRRISTQFVMYLGIEFYLFVSHGGMNYRGSTCKFRNARSAFRNLHVDPLSFIYTWFTRSYLYFIKIEPFWLGNICFLIQNTRSFFYGRHYTYKQFSHNNPDSAMKPSSNYAIFIVYPYA